MIRHDDRGVKEVRDVVIMNTAGEHDVAFFRVQARAISCAEGNEYRLALFLQMRQIATIGESA
jgi:hypothetical protein